MSTQHDPLPAGQPKQQTLPLPYTQTSFAPHFVNPHEGVFTSNVHINPPHTQVPKKKNYYSFVGPLISFPPKGNFNKLEELFLVKSHENHSCVCLLF